MATNYSPKIVRDGLGICLDAANPKSYPNSGNIWYDLSGNERNFTGNSSYIDGVNGIRSGVAWTCSSSLVNNLLNTDYHSIFFSIRFNSTISYPNATTGSFNKIFEHSGSSGDRSPGIWRWPNNRGVHWRYNPNNSGTDFAKSGNYTNDFDLNKWYLIGSVKDGSILKSYVNGVEVKSVSPVSNPKQTGNSNIILFSSYTADLANIKNLMIYDRVLSAEEIKQNYNALKGRFI